MKKIKGLFKVLLVIPIILMMTSVSFAAQDYWLMLYNKGNERLTGYYRVSTTGSTTKPVIKIVQTNNSSGSTVTDYNSAIYCLDNHKGFGAGDSTDVVNYNQEFDMRNPSEIGTPYSNALPSGTTYNKLMWLLDNICIPSNSTSRTTLLTAANLDADAFESYKNGQTLLRNDIIEVIQQSAIWHFTNSGDNQPGNEPSFYREQQNTTHVSHNIDDDNQDGSIVPGENPVSDLYSYLITEADKKSSYDYSSAGASPITYAKGFTDSTKPTSEIIGTNFVVGPYRINNDNSKALTSLAVTLTSGAKLVGADKTTELTGSNNENKIKNNYGKDFYISIPVSTSQTSVAIGITPTYTTKTITYKSAPAPEVNTSQPVVVIKTEPVTNPAASTVNLVKPEFDLALRKFITKLNNDSITDRIPDVKESKIAGNKTADYNHKKDPVVVQTGDKVQYTLRIYNEGQAAGRATKIIDQLPTGLAYSSVVSGSFELDNYDTSSNRLSLKRKQGNTTNLPAYSSGSLQPNATTKGYEDIVIECTVNATAGQTNDKVLTNVAWISEEYNAVTEQYIPNQGRDRDSEPETAPDVKKDTMSDYKGNNNNPTLSNSDYYYKGQQDDDDFEKLVIKPVNKKFDLALRKWIASVTPADGSTTKTNIRTITVDESPLKESTGNTALYKHSKNAIEVNKGDIVNYNLRIYNEGEVAGRATNIVDQLPEGLEFIEVVSGNFERDNYDASTNVLSLKRKSGNETNLPAYSEGSLQENGNGHETIVVRCKVKEDISENSGKVLTNIAWISKEVKDNGNGTETEITNQPELDRDSEPAKTPAVGKNSSEYQGTTTNPLEQNVYHPGQQDDDDFEKIIIKNKEFDLALRKFITSVDGNAPSVLREPEITQAFLQALANGTATFDNGKTTNKTHTKDPLKISKGSKIVYTIRVYNEGQVDGKATEITDYLPEGLKLAKNSTINNTYGWKEDTSNSQIVTTDYLKNTNLKAFNTTPTNGQYIMTKDGGQIADVQIECEVVSSTTALNKHLKNVAEITASQNDLNLPDRDSTAKNITDNQKGDKYNPGTSEDGKGYEDDDDYEDLLLVRFDLALRKFITGVNNEEIKNRVPSVDASKFGTTDSNGKLITTCTYNHTKEPVKVEHNDTVIYTIRVYNEGNVAGYAEIIKDDIPEGLEFLPDNEINKEIGWKMLDKDGNETTDVKLAKFITTDYRSKEKDITFAGYVPGMPYSKSQSNLILAFDPETMKDGPDFVDVQVAFKVTEPNTSDRIIINQAQVSKHSDGSGDSTIPDDDSTPDVWNEGEDDQDIEKIYVKYFDLSLRKWVTQAIVIEDGVQKEMDTGHKAEDDPESVVKVEINQKRLESTVVKFRYNIRIKNEGEIAGYATEISDYIPKGLKFNQADNPKWTEADGKIITDQLKDTLLQPGETATIDVLLTWENSESNMGVMVNVAEISKDKNDSDTPDIDSTPNNKKDGEDDIDDAPVALTVVAGSAPTYIAISSGIVAIVGAGLFFIKKYVI